MKPPSFGPRRRFSFVLAALFWAGASACTDQVNGSNPDRATTAFAPYKFTLPLSHPLAYVSNTGTDALLVVDLTDMSLAARLPLGVNPIDRDGPGAMAYDAVRHLLYVALTEPAASTYGPHSARALTKTGFIAVVNADDLQVVALLPVGRSPASLALSADGDTLWTSHSDGLRASQISDSDISIRRATVGRFSSLTSSLAAGTTPPWDVVTVCVLPEGLALDEGRGVLGVACAGEDTVAFVDTASLTVTARVSVARGGDLAKPVGLSLSPDASTWVVANRVARDVSFFAAGTPPVLGDRPELAGIPGLPHWTKGGALLVPTTVPDAIDVLDAVTHEVRQQHVLPDKSCSGPRHIAQGPSMVTVGGVPGAAGGASVLVVCAGDSTVQGRLLELDPSTFAIKRAIGLESYAHSVVVRQP